jgi:hypothetical protein
MTEVRTEITESAEPGDATDAAPIDEVVPETVTVPSGVGEIKVGGVALRAVEQNDEAFGDLAEQTDEVVEAGQAEVVTAQETDADDPAGELPENRDRAEIGAGTPAASGATGQPPRKPPEGGGIEDEVPDPEDDREQQEARAEAGRLIGQLGRFTHGPAGRPLQLGEDTQITDRIKTGIEQHQLKDTGLTDESVVGRKADAVGYLDEFDLSTEIEVLTVNEEVIPLEARLDEQQGTTNTPVARLFVFMKPGDETTAESGVEDASSHSTADVSVTVYRDLRSEAYMMADPFDEERGLQIESFLSRLGLEVQLPVSDATNRLGYDRHIVGLPAYTLRRINSFVREQLQ